MVALIWSRFDFLRLDFFLAPLMIMDLSANLDVYLSSCFKNLISGNCILSFSKTYMPITTPINYPPTRLEKTATIQHDTPHSPHIPISKLCRSDPTFPHSHHVGASCRLEADIVLVLLQLP